MDSFKEQIVRKIPTKNDKIQKIFIMIASVALAALCFIFPFGTQFSVIGIFLAAAALYGGYYLTTKLDVEYEYIFTNGEIDVDKITAHSAVEVPQISALLTRISLYLTAQHRFLPALVMIVLQIIT